MNRTLARTLTILVPVLALGCPSGSKDADKADAEKADAKAADVETADAKKAKTDGEKAGDDEKAEADAKKLDTDTKKAAGGTVKAPTGRVFRKGQHAPPRMTPEEVKAHAEAQGDPEKGDFTLEEALAGDDKLSDDSAGKLTAVFDTSEGKFECELYEDKAPLTVANFVGLARGIRPWYDKEADQWVKTKFFDGILFHRVVEGFMIQTGDPTGTGTGGPGYVIVDELESGLEHSKPGMLSMANRGPNTGSSQFFVTVVPTPHLDNKHTIFGRCDPKVAKKISKVKVDPRRNHRPYEDVKIDAVEIVRK